MAFLDYAQSPLRLELTQQSPILSTARVVVPALLVDTMYNQAVKAQQGSIQTQGFRKGTVPLEYIAQNYKSSLVEHLKEFLFNYFVVNFLFQQLRTQKVLVAGEPRLTNIHIEPGQDAFFNFDLSTFPGVAIQEWKYLPFKAPKRKKYKDLDRQVDSFIKDEQASQEKLKDAAAQIGDWVSFEITLVDVDGTPIIDNHKQSFWLKLGDEEADNPLRDVFIDKKVGESFCTTSRELQDFFSDHIDTQYHFYVTVTDILHNAYFCLDQFKRYFKLKTNKEVYQKLIEVFSYRNDLSQRRSMAEESLKLLLSKHRFEVPAHLVLRQQKKVLDAVQDNPDYHVYRMQKDFNKHVRQLAEKQARELILLDQMAYHENINVSNQDIKHYLNLTNRPRTKEFIYFDTPITKVDGQEIPIPAEELNRTCLREKTLNHMIYHLTKA